MFQSPPEAHIPGSRPVLPRDASAEMSRERQIVTAIVLMAVLVIGVGLSLWQAGVLQAFLGL
jgi:hypothetical protein